MDAIIDEDEDFKPHREIVREMEGSGAENKSLRDDLCRK